MPAETHQHGAAATTEDVLELLVACSPEHEDALRDAGTPLSAVDLDEEMTVLDFWDAATEEFAERSIGEPDLTELLDATTVGELLEATVRCLGGETGQTPAMGARGPAR